MLYDPRWQIKRDLSLRGLIAWLEAQLADKAYIHTFADECLLGQWLKFIDPKSSPVACGGYVYIVNGSNQNFLHLKDIACGSGPKDWTFGSALQRARQAMELRS